MNRAVELADENKDLTSELENVEKTNRLLEADAVNTAETLTQRLEHTRVNIYRFMQHISLFLVLMRF